MRYNIILPIKKRGYNCLVLKTLQTKQPTRVRVRMLQQKNKYYYFSENLQMIDLLSYLLITYLHFLKTQQGHQQLQWTVVHSSIAYFFHVAGEAN